MSADFTELEIIYRNEPLLYFECKKYDIKIIVNAGICCAYYGLELPRLGTIFNINDVSYHSHLSSPQGDEFIFSLCHRKYPKTLKCVKQKDDSNILLKMIPKYKLGCADLLVITKMYEDVKSTITPNIDVIPFILSYVDNILSKKFKPTDVPDCSSRKLNNIKCFTVSHCRQIQVSGNTYPDFPYWSFGTRWALKGEILIGSLFIHDKVGTICLKDSGTIMGCVIIKELEDDLRDIIDKPVYIEKFCVFTEIFNPNNKFNLEYLYLNFKDINVMGNKRKREIEVPSFKYEMKFLILGKSNITYTQDKGTHFWLEITEIKNYKEEDIGKCFLCLPERLVKDWPLLENKCYCTIRFNKELVKIRDYEYSRVDAKLPQYQVKSDNPAVILSEEQYGEVVPLPFLNSETLPNILRTTGLLSFQAILKYRKFNQNNSSRTFSSTTPIYFGTIGAKTHLIDFQVDKIKTLTLYLNNWERMINPLGLLPGALINVHNVQVQKTYCKSTAFTVLEIVEYKPRRQFQTARLLNQDDWGLKYFYGGPNNIPDGILVHCVFSKYKVIKMFMKRSCSQCFYMSRVPGDTCVECKGKMKTISELTVAVEDERGTSKITIKQLEVCRVFLSMNEEQWKNWLGVLELVGMYDFQRHGKYVNLALKPAQVRFIKRTNNLVKTRELRMDINIHMLCRKLDNSRNFDRKQPFWYGIKSRTEY